MLSIFLSYLDFLLFCHPYGLVMLILVICPRYNLGLPSSHNFWNLTSLVAQRLKHLPAMRVTWVRYLGWEDTWEKEMATHSSILAW